MKLTPFAVIYGGTLAAQAILSTPNTIHAGTVSDINAQIAEVNTNFALYGFGSSPNLPVLPAIPTPGSTAPQGLGYFQSQAAGGVGPSWGPSTSFLLIDAYTANGYSDPSPALDTLLTDTNLNALLAAARALRAIITVQPTNQSTVHTTFAFSVTATGAGLTYQWQRQALGVGAWLTLVDNAFFSGSQTANLAGLSSTVLLNNGDKYRVLVDAVGAAPAQSSTVTLTVT